MQTQDVITNKAGCTCRIEHLEHGWQKVGDACPFCKAWHLSIVTRSMEPLKEFGYGLEREVGETQADGDSGHDQAK